MLIKRPHYRPIPAGAQILTGRKGEQIARWTNSKGRTVSRPVNDRGDRIIVESSRWYVRLQDAAGQWFERKAYTDRTASEVLHAELATKVERGQVGMIDPMDEHRKRPLAEHLDAFERHLDSRENTDGHVELTMQRVRTAVTGIGAKVVADITPGRVEDYLKELRRVGLPTTGKRQRRPLSLSSSNHYLRAIRAFCNWLVKNRRVEANPLAGLSALTLNEQDKKRRRRALTDAEVTALVNAATVSGQSFRGISGRDRAMLYIVAMNTGLRASELASLRPTSFNLEGKTPVVCCSGAYTKNGHEATLPLRGDLVPRLNEWLIGRPADVLLWPGSWARSRAGAEMVRLDLTAARTAWLDEARRPKEREEWEKSCFLADTDSAGRVLDFHSLRHTFISNLARGGVHPKNAQALARHSTINLTMNVYTHTVLGDLANDVDKLPALPTLVGGKNEAVALAATGTDGPDTRPDDDPKRRTKRRFSGGSTCENVANGGKPWRNGGQERGGQENPENRQNSRELSSSGEPCLSLSTAEGGSRTHTRGEPDRILNPARLPVPPLRQLLPTTTKIHGRRWIGKGLPPI